MRFDFDIRKTIAAVGFLLERQGGELDMLPTIKMLYLADKQALIRWGNTITGDSYKSLPQGPVLREVYALFKGEGFADEEHQAVWDQYFSELVNYRTHKLQDIDLGPLSEREMEVLEEARRTINSMDARDVPDFLHETCPEWEDPRPAKSRALLPEAILRKNGVAEERIREIERSNDVFRRRRALLSNLPKAGSG